MLVNQGVGASFRLVPVNQGVGGWFLLPVGAGESWNLVLPMNVILT
jgi:hypothetical protein